MYLSENFVSVSLQEFRTRPDLALNFIPPELFENSIPLPSKRKPTFFQSVLENNQIDIVTRNRYFDVHILPYNIT